jgi:transcriptional regulator with XRE-family HTH domain
MAPVGTLDVRTPEENAGLIGYRCRALRLERNLSQANLAAMTDSSLSSIRRLEARGQGTLLLLARVAQALQAAYQFETFLALPAIRIADVEREAARAVRKRAGGPRRQRANK